MNSICYFFSGFALVLGAHLWLNEADVLAGCVLAFASLLLFVGAREL